MKENCDRLVIFNGSTREEEPGLVLHINKTSATLRAVTGRTPDPSTAWCAAPTSCRYVWSECLKKLLEYEGNSSLDKTLASQLRNELEARDQPSYCHLIPMMIQVVLGDAWPRKDLVDVDVFVALPHPKVIVESELVELLLLESLVEEMTLGDAHTRLLITHIESECGTPIGGVIAEQRSKLEQMLADQREQLRLHADIAERHEHRCKLKLTAHVIKNCVSCSASSDTVSASDSVVQLSDAVGSLSVSSVGGSSSSTASSSTAPDPHNFTRSATSVSTAVAACSWTGAHSTVQSIRALGRKKYGVIIKCAMRFLHSLNPVTVNRNGGSHIVFHFAKGSPVTLVQPHGGRSKDATQGASYFTRLYQTLHEVALRHNPNAPQPSLGSVPVEFLTNSSGH